MSQSPSIEEIMQRIRVEVSRRNAGATQKSGTSQVTPPRNLRQAGDSAQSAAGPHFELEINDLSLLRGEIDTALEGTRQVGQINPRNPGLHNAAIQFVKKVMRRSLTWYTRPLHYFQGGAIRALQRITGVLQSHEQSLQKISQELTRDVGLIDQSAKDIARLSENTAALDSSWRQNVPAFLNAVSSVGAFGHELARLRRELEEGFQSARHEILQEVEQGLQSVRHELRQEGEQGLQSVRHELRQEVEQEFRSVRRNLEQTGESVAATWERIEFARCEMLYEMKYGRPTSGASGPHVEARIVALKKVAAARQFGLKLNLGCGHIPLEGYVNVDRRELPGVDVVADVGDLPFEEGGVQEISSAHVLEHFPQEMLRRRLLPFWRTLLMPGGVFRAVVPDGEAMLAGVATGSYSFGNFREVLFGAQDYDGDFHFNLFTPDSLCGLLEEAGFKDIHVNARARPNGKCFEFDVSAVKPSLDRIADTPSSRSSGIDEPGAKVPP
jgi:hypothetical protein